MLSESQKKYLQSEKGKESQRKYFQSEKGKEALKRYYEKRKLLKQGLLLQDKTQDNLQDKTEN